MDGLCCSEGSIIYAKKLNLSEDAIIDNLGGYINIPENSFYLKISDKVYHIPWHGYQSRIYPSVHMER